MKSFSRHWIGRSLLAGAFGLSAIGANAQAADKPATAAEADGAGLVHCLLPGQVRRLGAFNASITPRRALRTTPAQCQAGGGEYVEPQDQNAAVKMWLPMATEGLAEAQTTVGELFQQRGNSAAARSWYEKAAAQGDTRSMINLAGLLAQTAGVAGGAIATAGAGAATAAAGTTATAGAATAGGAATGTIDRIADLMVKATGGLVAGLSIQRSERLRVEFVAPVGASPVPRASGGPLQLEGPAGPLQVVARVAGAAGVKSVRVNGQPQAVDEQGLVSIPVTVGEARTSVLVQAEDPAGGKAQAELVLVQRAAPATVPAPVPATPAPEAAASAAAPAVAMAEPAVVLTPVLPVPKPTPLLLPGKRLALVIANQQYQTWPRLDTPRADAASVAEVLKKRFGFDVTVVQDATRQQLIAALSRLRQQAGPQDQVVVYYAGHGQMDEVTARGYWIPVDGDAKDIAQWVSVIDVTDQLSAMTARHVLVIADSCYSGTLTRSLVPVVDQALTQEQRLGPLKQLSRLRARVAMTSGGLEPVVDGGSIDHSLFARSLLDVLGQVNAPVAAQELHAAVAARFAHLARRLKIPQQPQYAPIGFAGHEAGDFVFSPI